MAALDIDTAIQNVKSMLAGLTAWQTICGVADSTRAAERIYEYGVDESTQTLCPCILLDLSDQTLPWNGGKFQGNVTIEVRMELEIPQANRATYSTQGRWFWQKLQALLAEIDTTVNDTGTLMIEEITIPLKPGRIDPDTNSGRCEWMTILGFRVYLK